MSDKRDVVEDAVGIGCGIVTILMFLGQILAMVAMAWMGFQIIKNMFS